MDSQQTFKAFLQRIEEVNTLISSANSLFLQFAALKRQALSAEARAAATEHADSVLLLTQKFQALFRTIEERIAQLQAEQSQDPTPASYLQNTHLKGAAERIQKISRAFHQEEEEMVEAEQERLLALYRVAHPGASDNELGLLESAAKGEALLKAAFSVGNKAEQAVIEEAGQRHRHIQALLASLGELSSTAARLNQVISQTDESLSTISYRVHASSQQSSASNRHLLAGIKRRKRRRTLRMIFLGAVTIVVTIAMLWVLLKLRAVFGPSRG